MLITVSGLPGSGTTTTSEKVAQSLNVEHVYAGAIFRKLAVEKGMTLQEFGKYAEEHPEVDWELDRRMVRRAKRGDLVLEGRLTGWIAVREEIPGFKVWLDCPDETRAERVAVREGLTKEQALEANTAREESEWRRYKDIYDIDLRDHGIYDLIVDTSQHGPDAVAQMVEDAAKAHAQDGDAGTEATKAEDEA